MSDSEDSTITYTSVSSPFEGLSNIGSPGVDGPPMMPEDPYAYVVATFQATQSSDYVPGLEEPEQAPLSPEFVPEPPLLATVSPTADLPGYIPESDLEEDPKEDDDEDPEEDPADYPTDRDDDDDDGEEPSGDEADDKEEDKDDEEEEEHPALADSVPPPPIHLVERFLAIPTLPPSPLTPLSSPLPQIPYPPLPVSPPLPISPPPLLVSPTYPLGFRATMIRQRARSPSTSHSLPLPPPITLSHTGAFVAMMRAAAPSTYILASRLETPPSETPPSGTPLLLPIPLPTSSPPLLLPSTDRRADRPGVCLPPRKRLCIALGPRYEVGESSSAPTARPTGDASDTNCSEVRALRTTVLAQQAEIGALRAADRTRQTQLMEILTLLRTLQTHMAEL
ncbi:hypothetical protein Tco_0009659 [Tanacetum coccineum]